MLRRHPVITGTIAGLALVGAVLGLLFLSEDWSAPRRALAGAVAGAGTGLVITASRLYG